VRKRIPAGEALRNSPQGVFARNRITFQRERVLFEKLGKEVPAEPVRPGKKLAGSTRFRWVAGERAGIWEDGPGRRFPSFLFLNCFILY